MLGFTEPLLTRHAECFTGHFAGPLDKAEMSSVAQGQEVGEVREGPTSSETPAPLSGLLKQSLG